MAFLTETLLSASLPALGCSGLADCSLASQEDSFACQHLKAQGCLCPRFEAERSLFTFHAAGVLRAQKLEEADFF